MMKKKSLRKRFYLSLLSISLILLYSAFGCSGGKDSSTSLASLLPKTSSWELAEESEEYYPANLFEYINGAAEIYLNYDFKKLIVAQYRRKKTSASITVEIYDMGNEKNAFGIYSIERYPDSNFLTIGNGSYVEEGILNFITGTYYIKLLCFDCVDNSEGYLKDFAREITSKVENKMGLPEILDALPEQGLVQNSEKYVLRNFLGFSFLHDGYIAQYRVKNTEFDCFIVEGTDIKNTQEMLNKYLEHYSQDKDNIVKHPFGYHIKDTYYKNIFVAVVGNSLVGVQRITDGNEETGVRFITLMTEELGQEKE